MREGVGPQSSRLKILRGVGQYWRFSIVLVCKKLVESSEDGTPEGSIVKGAIF
jgi:hypothetical protein